MSPDCQEQNGFNDGIWVGVLGPPLTGNQPVEYWMVVRNPF
jgi:hypothetical protein